MGLKNYNNERIDHGQNPVTYLEYIKSGSFMEAAMENWENEFLHVYLYPNGLMYDSALID